MRVLRRLSSWRHGFWLKVSESVRFSRGVKREPPALTLSLPAAQQLRARQLAERFGVCFETRFSAKTSLNNYEYLDLLERGFAAAGISPPQPRVLTDVGSASFWYAPALAAFFRPAALVGIELEGHRLFRDWHTRIDYARGYLTELPFAEFVIADYSSYVRPADLITAIFPFLTEHSVLAWRLPLTVLSPGRLFSRIASNLTADGLFFMINHGPTEGRLAHQCCVAAGLRLRASWAGEGDFSGHRLEPAMLSWWARGSALNLG
jgi:hypothetical protein